MITTAITLAVVLAAAVCDFATKRIPNIITLPAMAVGLILNIYNSSLVGGLDSLAGLLIGGGLLVMPFLAGGMGGGDVKILAAVGAINGFKFVIAAFLFTAVSGGIMALALILLQGSFKHVMANVASQLRSYSGPIIGLKYSTDSKRTLSGIRFPYGIAVLTGTAIALWLR